MKDSAFLAVVRHVLTIGAGALASRGIIGESDVEVIASSLLAIGVVIWSIYEKKRSVKVL